VIAGDVDAAEISCEARAEEEVRFLEKVRTQIKRGGRDERTNTHGW
jgi:hypothetical protein